MGKYAKAIAAIGGALIMLGSVIVDGKLTGEDVWAVVVAIGTALGVYSVPNAES